MAEHRAPESGEMQAPGPVQPDFPPTAPIKRAGQAPVDTDRPDRNGRADQDVPIAVPAVVDDRFSGDTPTSAAEEPPRLRGRTKRPEPVLDAARVAGAISAVILAIGGLLKLAGIVIPNDYDLQPLADQAAAAVLAVGAAWTVVGPWITARIRARDKVTPLVDPRDAYGRRLTPEES